MMLLPQQQQQQQQPWQLKACPQLNAAPRPSLLFLAGAAQPGTGTQFPQVTWHSSGGSCSAGGSLPPKQITGWQVLLSRSTMASRSAVVRRALNLSICG